MVLKRSGNESRVKSRSILAALFMKSIL